MKKRIVSLLLTLAMVFTMVPAVATAVPVETVASPKAGTHAATGHTCEKEGCAATEWQSWPTDGTIPTEGHYYLTGNVQLTGQIGLSNKTLHICLNGYVMTAKADNRLAWTYGTAELVITDCTAYEENGVYYAGSVTGGKATDSNGGGAFFVRANGTVELHDGKITDCTATAQGGAIANSGTVKLYGGELAGNAAVSGTATKHGGAIFNNSSGTVIAENVRFTDNHADYGEGGVLQNWGNASFKNCTFTGNNAATGGALNLGGTNKTVMIDGCTFTGNTAGVVSAIQAKIATGSITIKDTTITGNSNNNGFGAVNVIGSAAPVVLAGKVVITGNTQGETTANNLHVQDGATDGIDASSLAAESSIGVHLRGSRTAFTTANAANNKAYFVSDVSGYIVTLNADNKLQLEAYVAPEHPHCVCGKTDCTDASHTQLEYQKLTSADQLAAGGAFYLEDDLSLSKAVGIRDGVRVTICLNGHTLTSDVTNSPLFWTYDEAQINICDCTAHRDTEGVYQSGAISGVNNTGTTGGTFFLRDKGVLNFYGGQILNCTDKKGGGAIRIEAGGKLNFYDGIISGCSSETGGGAIFNSGNANIFGGEFVSNKALLDEETKNGGAIFNNATGILYAENAVFAGNHADYGNGGALQNWGSVTLRNCTFTGNNANTGGALSLGGSKTVLIEDCTFTGNTAAVVSAIQVNATGSVTLKDTEITGNSNVNGFGAVNVTGSAAPVILQGDMNVTGNTKGDITQNLHVQAGAVDGYDVSGLSADAKLGISLQNSRINADTLHFTTASEKNNTACFTSDDSSYTVTLNAENKLYLQYNYTHIHCVCGKTDCTDDTHEKLRCKAWTDATRLPPSGSYYLETDVTVTAQTRIENTTVNLCLNGHTITAQPRAYYITNGGKLTITDCQAEGKITGATDSAILTNNSGTDMEVNLYAGAFTGNHSATTGGALVIQGECTFNMYGGIITGNSAASGLKTDENGEKTYTTANAGGVYIGSGAVFNMYGGEISHNEAIAVDGKGGLGGGLQVAYGATANLLGGKIADNTAYNGGGIFLAGEGTVLNLKGTEVSGNTANNGGGILSQTKAVTNLTAGSITGNRATGNGGGMYVSTDTTLNMTGGEFTGNKGTYGGGLYVLSADATLSGGSISGNQAKSGAGVYVSTITSRNRPSMIQMKEGVRITENTATENGGGIVINGEGTKLIMTGGEISKNSGKFAGGVLTQTQSTFELRGGKITGNKSVSGGGGGYISIGTKLVMTGGSVTGNTVSKGHGGGFYLYRSIAEFKSGAITGNTSVSGGGLKITGAKVTITGLSVTDNYAAGQYVTDAKTGESKLSRGFGGGLYIGSAGYTEDGVRKNELPVVNVYNIYLANNKTTGAAGGVLVESEGSVFNMYGGTITGNVAEVDGGGAYFSTKTKATITGGTISNNKGRNGGGIYFLNCESSISGVKIHGNEATSSAGAFLLRGKTTKVTMQNVEVYDNYAEGASGAAVIQTYATLHLSDAKFYKNTAKLSAGAIYYSDPGYGTMTNVEIYENTAGGDAGGVYVGTNSIVTMDNVTVRDNTAGKNYGGGIHSRGRLNIKNSKILGNTVHNGSGGGIGTSRAASILLGQDIGVYAENCVISGNYADLVGGGINGHIICPLYLTDCVITDNESGAEGGGIHAEGRMGLQNVTVTGNVSGGEGYAVYLMPSEYDGHSYQTGHKYMGGEMIVKDNENGDMYLGEGSVLAVTGESLGEKSHVNITLHDGVLSQYVLGVYNYEGSNLKYTITAGNRSITDPEPLPGTPEEEVPNETEPTEPDGEETETGNGALIAGIAGTVLVLLIAALVIVLAARKKKSAK